MTSWPRGARGALCLSFDNLGEAAEVGAGVVEPGASRDLHPTVATALPAILDALEPRRLAATFFVEGLNAELHPEALREIAGRGHEVAYHAWLHEQWGDLDEAQQADNLARGVAAFASLDLPITGMRPPGGQLGPFGLEVLRRAGLSYCSPAGREAGLDANAADGIALLPFDWRHVDASCVLPPLAQVREKISGSPEPLGPGPFLAFLEEELESLAGDGGFLAIVLHPFMLSWLGQGGLATLLDRLVRHREERRLWVARCDEIAAHVLANPATFRGATSLDPTSWSG